MQRHFIIMIFILGFSCHHNSKDTKYSDMENKLTVTGTAQDGKWGALLVSKTGDVYYIDELESWDSAYLEKEVEVTGILKEETFQEQDLKNEKGEWTQGISGKETNPP